MTFWSRNCSLGKLFSFVTFITMFLCSEGALKPDEVATVVGKAFTYKLPAELAIQNGHNYKLHISGGERLPSWLTFDADKNLLLGVPSHHDKGSHVIQVDVVNNETNKVVESINFLSIDVVQYDEDLNHYNILKPSPLQIGQNTSQSPLDCPGNMPIIVATIVLDLSARKLSGTQRVELLKRFSEWSDVDVEKLRFLPGKGDKTAFNLKDVILLTAGPGYVNDALERGVCVSWKIGCGVNIAGIPFVMHLKSASENGAFKNELRSPVVAWHVTHGMLNHRQVIRVRRQAAGQTPQPTSAFVPPTVSVVTRVSHVPNSATPTVAPSPTVLTITPTSIHVMQPTQRPSSPNMPPVLMRSIATLFAEVDVDFYFLIPEDTFQDEDGNTPFLNLKMTKPDGNPLIQNQWLKLDADKQFLYGKPTENDLAPVVVGLIVSDRENKYSEIVNVEVKVRRHNHPPRLINHIDLIKLFVGQPIKFTIPYDTFWDVEDGDTTNLTLAMYTIEGKPLALSNWVTFDARTRTIYALPRGNQIGKPEFLMVATDHRRKKARDAFEFHILEFGSLFSHKFGLVLKASFAEFQGSVINRVDLCIFLGGYFGSHFNTSYKDIRVRNYKEGSVVLEWSFANIATDIDQAHVYKEKYMIGDDQAVDSFKNDVKSTCPINSCSVEKVYVWIFDPNMGTTPDPNVLGRGEDRGGGTWWKYTIIPAFVVAALIFIIGLIIIICLRCRRKSKLMKNDKVVFLYRKKPAVFREEYPLKEVYGNQPLLSPCEKPPLPPPSYPRSSTPTDDPNVTLLSDSAPSYQPPSFDSGHEQPGNTHVPVPSYRLPPPYVSP